MKFFGMIVCMVGVFLISMKTGGDTKPYGVIWCIISTFSCALLNMSIKQAEQKHFTNQTRDTIIFLCNFFLLAD